MNFKSVLNQVVNAIEHHPDRPAITIGDQRVNYREFGRAVSAVRTLVKQSAVDDRPVGVVLQDDFRTYAALIGLWLEGRAYVPINPQLPSERNGSIIQQSDLLLMLNAGASILDQVEGVVGVKEVDTQIETDGGLDLSIVEVPDDKIAYILYTSGSTGVPKGVPITRANVAAFMEGVDAMELEFSCNDRFMQMFDLTFDLSVWSFLQPLCVGAEQFPIPHGEIKFMYAYELLEECQITVALMVPSVLNFLRPYFGDLQFTSMRYSLFCGEALYSEIAREWLEVVPDARVFNVYGPTEATIFCTQYELNRGETIPSANGIVTLGEPLLHASLVVLNEQLQKCAPDERGELCIGGLQVTPGYVRNQELNQKAFFSFEGQRVYRSGDIAYYDRSGNLMYSGRLDSQIKIQGFRIELSEIEFQARAVVDPVNVAAVALADPGGQYEIHLFVEGGSVEEKGVLSALKQRLPSYMIPKAVHAMGRFPLNANGKTDRNALKGALIAPAVHFRRATRKDLDFLVEVVINAEKSGTERLSYSTIFKLGEEQVKEVLRGMISENEGYCELSIDPFLIAEVGGERAAAVAAWVEGEDEIPSAIVKANLLFSFMPPSALEHLRTVSTILDQVHIPRINGALQLESIYTVPKFRGMGLAKRLIDQHVTEAKQLHPDLNRAQIILSDINESALRAYKKADFELTLHKKSADPLVQEILPSGGNYSLEKSI